MTDFHLIGIHSPIMFSGFVASHIEAYVYVLIDPRDNRPFYIGKGRFNRVFDHATGAITSSLSSDKLDLIREIIGSGLEVKHLILRHGLTDSVALDVESALIDFCSVLNLPLTNLVLGHHSWTSGAMTTDEVERKYSGDPLEVMEPGFVLININRTYGRAKGIDSYYEATRKSWVINRKRIPSLKYALAEYRGFIVAVYEISEWYEVLTKDKKGGDKIRWAFHGLPAAGPISSRYLNKSVAKKRGEANPLKFNYNRSQSTAPAP